MSEESNNILIDNEEYAIDDMDDTQKYYLNQVRNLRQRIAEARFNLDQLAAAESQFSNQLVSSVKSQKEESNEES
tara:strand:- start:288 stop:512 length:225 start_codon:yes stop_codon:yes gene_type:complete